MSESKTYQGSCHCGAVKFQATTDLAKPVSCNCSICGRTGWVLTFVPEASFLLHAGADSLTDYQFGKKRLHHTFCKVCGVRPFSRGAAPDGKVMIAVNVRCLEGLDPDSLPVTKFDGARL
jgi:hypothetical protein